jgi:hypothetical protein
MRPAASSCRFWLWTRNRPPHILGEVFKSASGVELNFIPYRGGEQARSDLLGGRADPAACSTTDRRRQTLQTFGRLNFRNAAVRNAAVYLRTPHDAILWVEGLTAPHRGSRLPRRKPMLGIRRREFIALLGGAAASGPVARGRSSVGSGRWRPDQLWRQRIHSGGLILIIRED